MNVLFGEKSRKLSLCHFLFFSSCILGHIAAQKRLLKHQGFPKFFGDRSHMSPQLCVRQWTLETTVAGASETLRRSWRGWDFPKKSGPKNKAFGGPDVGQHWCRDEMCHLFFPIWKFRFFEKTPKWRMCVSLWCSRLLNSLRERECILCIHHTHLMQKYPVIQSHHAQVKAQRHVAFEQARLLLSPGSHAVVQPMKPSTRFLQMIIQILVTVIYTLVNVNSWQHGWLESRPGLKMLILLKIGILHCYVSLPEFFFRWDKQQLSSKTKR